MKHFLNFRLTAILLVLSTLLILPACEPEPDPAPSISQDPGTNESETNANPFVGYYQWTASNGRGHIVAEIKRNQYCEHILKPQSSFPQHFTTPFLITIDSETGLTSAYNLKTAAYELWKWELNDGGIRKTSYPYDLSAYGSDFSREILQNIITDYASKNMTAGGISSYNTITGDDFLSLLNDYGIDNYDISVSPIANKLKGNYIVVANRNYDLFEMEFGNTWRYKDMQYFESGKVSPMFTGKFSISDNYVVLPTDSYVVRTTGVTKYKVQFLDETISGQTLELTLTADNGTTLTLTQLD